MTLTGTEVLQGTFLAPEGDVEVKSNLAGAVYADKITVADSVSDLKRIVLIEGAKAEETESESETEATTETETEATTETETEATTETETEATTETAAETETEVTSETTAETETEVTSETTAEAETEVTSETTAETETEVTSETTAETETEVTSEITTETETESEAVIEPTTEAPQQTEETETPQSETAGDSMITIDDGISLYSFLSTRAIATWSSQKGVELKFKLTDADDAKDQALAGGEAVIRSVDAALR